MMFPGDTRLPASLLAHRGTSASEAPPTYLGLRLSAAVLTARERHPTFDHSARLLVVAVEVVGTLGGLLRKGLWPWT